MKPVIPFLLLLVFACQTAQAVTAPERTSVSIDIYNRDLAMIHDTRLLVVSEGVQIAEFTGISEGIFGHTAEIRPVVPNEKILTRELSYNYDLISQEKLLQRYLMSWFSFTADDATYQGTLIAFDDDHLFLKPDSLSNEIHVVERGKLSEMFYPGFPDRLYFQPTLRWETESEKRFKDLPVELSYLTTGISWFCDYRGELISGDSISLGATFTIANDLSLELPGANVSLVIAKPHRSSDPEGTSGGDEVSLPGSKGGKGSAIKSPEKLGELHRYTLPRPVHLSQYQTIQIPFFSDQRIKIERRFFFPHLLEDQTVAEQVKFSVPKGLFGQSPLPEGDVSLFHRAKDGNLLFCGQDFIPITPVNGVVELTVGQATNISARRMRLAQNRPTRDTSEETWQVEVVNGGDKPATVWTEQRVFGYYKIVKAEVDGKAVIPETTEAGRLLFPVEAPSQSKATLTFTLSYGY